MTSRDAYVRKLKEQIDLWNAELSKLEVKAKQPLTGVKENYEKQLKALREQRDTLHRQMLDIQKSSEHAWDNLRTSADKAWKTMEEGFKKAWLNFK
jgi:DNA anti-recombination protein RmuC